MDTNSGPVKRNLRADITRKFDERVAATLERVDPHRAKAREVLGDVEGFELEEFSSAFAAPKHAKVTPTSYLDAPLLTLRQLMPGSTGEGEDDGELDQAFRADKIEFLVMHRELTPNEVQQECVIEDIGDVDWGIPNQEEFEDLMGKVVDVFTDEQHALVEALKWSSVGSATGVGCFSVGTGNLGHMNDIRDILRNILHHGYCFESFPRKAMMKSFSFTAFFPRSTKYVGMEKLVEWLLLLNRGLRGTIWPSVAKKFPDTHPSPRKRGARILSFTGEQEFLDSLHSFPKGYPFSIKIANVYIEGGERTKEGKTVLRRKRPKMTQEALNALLKRHGKEIIDNADANDEERAGVAREANARQEARKP